MILVNTLPGKRFLGGFIFLLACLSLPGCVNRHDDPVLIQIDDYSITRGKFMKYLDKLNKEPISLTAEEKINMVLDNIINAGLLLSLSRRDQCFNDETYQRKVQYYKDILYSKYGKIFRCGLKGLPTGIDDDHDVADVRNTTLIDYIYIPSSQKQICKDMQDRMNAGAMTVDLLKSPKIGEWNSAHLRFYSNIPASQALLPEDVLQKIKKLKPGKLSTFQHGPGTYIVKVIKQFTENGPPPSAGEILLQSKMVTAIENGDTLIDPYDLGRLSRINDGLYDQLDLVVQPIANRVVPGNTDPVVVEFLGRKMTETQLKIEISGLPASIQTLFRSKSTRIMAVVNYILHTNAGLLGTAETEKTTEVSRIRQLVDNRLRQSKVTDTVAWLVELFRQKSTNGDTGPGPSGPQDSEARTDLKDRRPWPAERSRDYSWIFDDNQPGHDSLKLNFQMIRKMDFGRISSVPDDKILASANNWKLRVGDFRKQLERLSPYSRVDLCKSDNGSRAIYYLAQSQCGPDNKAALKINYALLDQIDLVGDGLDALLQYRADGVVASLRQTVLTEDKIRDIVAAMPENERTIFLPESDNRKDALKKILADQFWRDQVRTQQMEENAQFREEIKNYENWLLADTYYNKLIYVRPYELNDESLDPCIKKACKLLSQERLREALVKAAGTSCIKVDANLFGALGGNTARSAYSGLINKNCH